MKKVLNCKITPFIIAAIVSFPFAITILFSTPSADDFTMAADLNRSSFDCFIMQCIDRTNHMYLDCAGGWPFNFLQYLINPLIFSDSSSYLYGVELLVIFIIFLFILFCYFWVILKYLFNYRNITVAAYIYVIFLFAFLNSLQYSEIFYWFIGNSYLWELMFMMLNQILIVMYFQDPKSKKYFVLLLMVGFVACFAYMLDVVSGLLYIIQLILIYNKNKKIKIIYLLPLFIMIIGGVLGSLAPGNFLRHEVIDPTGLHLLLSIKLSVKNCFYTLIKTIGSPLYLFIILVSSFIGFFLVKNIKVSNWFIVFLLFSILFIFVLVFFPCILGYSNDGIPNRILFLINFIIYSLSLFFFLCLGCWLRSIEKNYNKIIHNKTFVIFIFCVFFAFVFSVSTIYGKMNLSSLPWFYNFTNIEECYSESCIYKMLYKDINNNRDRCYVVSNSEYTNRYKTGIIKDIKISDNKDNMENIMVAYFYDKEYIVVKGD